MTHSNTNTAGSFRDKWENNPEIAFTETLREKSDIFQWILTRNGFQTKEDFTKYLSGKKRILDAGCGNGRVTALLRVLSSTDAPIVGIDLVAADVAKKNLRTYKNISIYGRDLLGDLSDLDTFDFIYCQEVLHHTANPKKAFGNLCSLLAKGGEIAIYVYKKKAPVREYVDDFIRDKIAGLSYDKAIVICKQIAEMGNALSNLGVTVKVPSIDILEIPAGEYDVQRFIYHFFMKCFWNQELSVQDNTVINYDWYHPQLCARHTLEEIREWFHDNNLIINHENVDFYGITVRGEKI